MPPTWYQYGPQLAKASTFWVVSGVLYQLAATEILTACVQRYKDALHFGKDGFFQAGQHNKKMDHDDPALSNGAAYFVDNEEYAQYLKEMNQYQDIQEEVS